MVWAHEGGTQRAFGLFLCLFVKEIRHHSTMPVRRTFFRVSPLVKSAVLGSMQWTLLYTSILYLINWICFIGIALSSYYMFSSQPVLSEDKSKALSADSVCTRKKKKGRENGKTRKRTTKRYFFFFFKFVCFRFIIYI